MQKADIAARFAMNRHAVLSHQNLVPIYDVDAPLKGVCGSVLVACFDGLSLSLQCDESKQDRDDLLFHIRFIYTYIQGFSNCSIAETVPLRLEGRGASPGMSRPAVSTSR